MALHGDIVQTRAGTSTVLADVDFETYSEAGYEWLESEQKWVSTGSKAAPGLAAVGTAVYAAHPSTEVLSLAYDLKDGLGARLWAPGMPPPADLFAHIASGRLLEAHNSFFEFCIWNYVCHARMGWPMLDYRQLRCSAAKSKAWSLPAALIKGGEALHLPVLKDEAAGKRVIQRYSIPRKPTAKDPRRRIRPDEEFEGIDLYQYNIQDIVAEAALSAAVPDLSPDEQEMWLIDQRINIRGVQIDIPTVHAMTRILDAGLVHNDRALVSVTNGALVTASEVSKMQAYLHGLGVHLDALDEEAVDAALKIHTQGLAYDVLRIRQASASAGVKKLYALARQTNDDHRYRGLFNYYRAHTGRWSSEGFQTQNLVSSGPDMRHCDHCHGEFPFDQEHCRHCEHDVFVPLGKAREWNGDIMQTCIRMLEHGDFNRALRYFGVHLFAVMSACLRGMVIARDGYDLISSDYSAIEAVVLAVLAGETWRIEVFNTHGKIYESCASKISGVPLDEIVNHKKLTGQQHPLRKPLGKIPELACFTRDTQVLTSRGYVRITGVLKSDLLWDGAEWVRHAGVVPKGARQVLRLDGVGVTPDHPISMGSMWCPAKALGSDSTILTRALEIGSENLPSWIVTEGLGRGTSSPTVFVRAATRRPLTWGTFGQGVRRGVSRVLASCTAILTALANSETPSTGTLSQTRLFVADFWRASRRLLRDVIKQLILTTRTTALAGFESATSGAIPTGLRFLPTSSLCRGGTTTCSTWTGGTTNAGTSRATSDLSPAAKTCLRDEPSQVCNSALTNLSDVYDIAHAGPRNRFTIKTDSGHLIVHNSGYAGWLGAWKNFGADEYMSDDQIKKAILKWREDSPAIVEFWGGQWRKAKDSWDFTWELYGLEGTAIKAVLDPGVWHPVNQYIRFGTFNDVLYMELPSGRRLSYHEPRLSQVEDRFSKNLKYELTHMIYNTNAKKGGFGWVRVQAYGGTLCENAASGTSRDILANGIKNCERAGYDVVMHVHDEIVAEVPEGWGSVEELEALMMDLPVWAKGWPIKASGGWRGKRYRKE